MAIEESKKNNKKDERKKSLPKDKDIIVAHKKAMEADSLKNLSGENGVDHGGQKGKINIVEFFKQKLRGFLASRKTVWEAPRIIKTNLIKGEVTSYFDWKNSFIVLFKYLLISFLSLAVVYVALVFWEMDIKKRGVGIKDEVDTLNQTVIEKESKIKEIGLFHQKITVAEALLDKHIYWTNFFDFLENIMLEDVYIVGGFSGNTGRTYSFSAVAKDYDTLAAQMLVFENSKDIESVSINGGTAVVSGDIDKSGQNASVNFKFSLTLRKGIFNK